jgi:diguanylate cyclase (GGDEF)-like protein
LVAVHDKKGDIRAIETDSAALAKRAVWALDVTAGLFKPKQWKVTDERGREVFGVMLPVRLKGEKAPIGQLTIAFKGDDPDFAAAGPWWGFYGPLLLVALIAWWLGYRLLFRDVVEPFRRMGRLGAQIGSDLPVGRDDQLGALAKAFTKLHEEIDHWRGETKRLELTLDRRVESQTKDYLKDLRRVTREAGLDPLTGLYNRRILRTDFEQIVAEHVGSGADLSVVMIDVDNFKEFNDALGHAPGDELLSFIGKLLSKAIREKDLAVRFGGDEFALILPDARPDEAERIAQRLAALFGQFIKTLPATKPTLSLSAGVAGLKQVGVTTGSDLLRAADEALYQAKAGGKGHVVVAESAASATSASPR